MPGKVLALLGLKQHSQRHAHSHVFQTAAHQFTLAPKRFISYRPPPSPVETLIQRLWAGPPGTCNFNKHLGGF